MKTKLYKDKTTGTYQEANTKKLAWIKIVNAIKINNYMANKSNPTPQLTDIVEVTD